MATLSPCIGDNMPCKIDWDLMVAEGYPNDYAMLEDMYSRRGMTLEEIGQVLGVNKYTVRSRLVALGIKIRGRGGRHRHG